MISSHRSLTVPKKSHVWIVRPRPGPHACTESVPLAVVIRDYLKLASNTKEIKYVLNHGEVLVDGRVVKDPSFPIGLMDSVSIPKVKRSYRVEIDRNERLVLKDIGEKESNAKLCRIRSKTAREKGKFMLGLHDGKTVPGDNNYKVGDTVKLALPDNKIEKLLKLEPGARCLVVSGKHAGKIAKLKELRSVGNKKYEAHMEHEDGAFITVKPYLFVVE